MSGEPIKAWYQCRKCGMVKFDYVPRNAEKSPGGLPLSLCNKCSPKRPSYRHVPHPDQGEFDFGGRDEDRGGSEEVS